MALLAAFSFQKRAFGQDIAASELISVLQGVSGVVAVDLQRLGETDGPLLKAHTARWDEDEARIRPAQLLLLKNETSIDLTMEKVS